MKSALKKYFVYMLVCSSYVYLSHGMEDKEKEDQSPRELSIQNSVPRLQLNYIKPLPKKKKQLKFIRHAEKPKTNKNTHLSRRGNTRSHALIGLFAPMQLSKGGTLPKNAQKINDDLHILPPSFGQPTAIYAKGQKSDRHSIRPIATVTPLSEKLGIKINSNFTEDDFDKNDPSKFAHKYKDLIEDMMNNTGNGQITLNAWEHNGIPTAAQEVMNLYGHGHTLPKNLSTPKLFKKYDRVLSFTFEDGVVTAIENLAQELLHNDSPSSTNEHYIVTKDGIIKQNQKNEKITQNTIAKQSKKDKKNTKIKKK